MSTVGRLTIVCIIVGKKNLSYVIIVVYVKTFSLYVYNIYVV